MADHSQQAAVEPEDRLEDGGTGEQPVPAEPDAPAVPVAEPEAEAEEDVVDAEVVDEGR